MKQPGGRRMDYWLFLGGIFKESFLLAQGQKELICPPNPAHNLDISPLSFAEEHLKVTRGGFFVIILNIRKNSMKR